MWPEAQSDMIVPLITHDDLVDTMCDDDCSVINPFQTKVDEQHNYNLLERIPPSRCK